jgi:CDP-diglyceride synthetase
MALILSTAALLLGPMIYAAARGNRLLRRTLDALILLTIAAIIAVNIIPEALEHGGKLAVVVLFLGIAFPMLLERLFRSATDAAHLVIVAIAAIGLLVHAVIDGIALLPESGTGLAHAIVLHRLPVGMALWWAVQPNFGRTAAVIVFAVVILATVAGYFVGEAIIELAEIRTIAMLQAFVSGSLIHVIAFGVKHDHN